MESSSLRDLVQASGRGVLSSTAVTALDKAKGFRALSFMSVPRSLPGGVEV